MAERLDKIVAGSGNISRKEVKQFIKQGRVSVNGRVASSAETKVSDTDIIMLDGAVIAYDKVNYFMMNKPAGFISSTDDPGRTVLELVPEEYSHLKLFPAGRLDKDSVGLLILTDDGDYCHNVISPKKNVMKKYYVRVDGVLTERDKKAFADGITLSNGESFLPGILEPLSENEAYVYIREGKYHQVKRMLGYLGSPVTYLKRMSIGRLELDESLKEGEMKKLTRAEAELVFEPFGYFTNIN